MADDILSPQWRRAEALKKTDRRSRKTRAALAEALIELLEQKPLSSISVSELTRRADVNRTTFYAHYQDVFDMFNQLKREFCDICGELVDAHAEEIASDVYAPLLHDILEYFSANKGVFRVVLGDNADGSLFQEIIATVHARCLAAAKPFERAERAEETVRQAITTHREDAEMLCEMQFDYIAGGVINAMRRWIENDCKQSVDLMTEALDSLIAHNQYQLLAQNLKLIASKKVSAAEIGRFSATRSLLTKL